MMKRTILLIAAMLPFVAEAGPLSHKILSRAVAEKCGEDWPAEDKGILYEHHPESWTREDSLPIPETIEWVRANEGAPSVDWANPLPGPRGWADCDRTVHRYFVVGDDSIGITVARRPERCSETPKLIWFGDREPRGSVRLAPLYNMNVETIWRLSAYVLFGARASFEGGGRAERLVIWHPDSNTWYTFAGPDKRISPLAGDWLSAKAGQFGDTIVLRTPGTAIFLRPSDAAWGTW